MHVARPVWAVVCLVCVLTVSAQAELPQEISWQGRILDSLGTPVTQNDLSLRFLIYPDSTGGSFVWAEVTQKDVVDGLASHRLGSTSSFPDTLFTAFDSLWLEVLVDGQAIEPRSLLVAAPFAMRSVLGPGISQNLTGGVFAVSSTGFSAIYADTITCPADGFILAMVSVEAWVDHVQGTESDMQIGLSPTDNTLFGDQDKNWTIPSASPTGTYHTILAGQKIFSATAGPNEVFLNARKGTVSSPDFNIQDITMSLMYIPVAYGGANTSAVPANLDDDVID